MTRAARAKKIAAVAGCNFILKHRAGKLVEFLDTNGFQAAAAMRAAIQRLHLAAGAALARW
jgi:hypothetical protein